MKNSVWALNVALLLIFFVVLVANFLLQRSLPPKQSMVPTTVQLPQRQTVSPVDIRRIYENDLFKTYVPSVKPEEPEEVLDLNPPQAPPMQAAPRINPPMMRFLDPLKIDLKGIITTSDPHNNKAIIADEKTKKELNYKVGDVVEDAEIIRIERNKVIFVRSNGQQEVVFLTQREANKDAMFAPKIPWYEIIHQTSPVSFTINKALFKERVKNIVQLIEMLDVTTMRDGTGAAVGCVIGTMPSDSIGYSLGLRTGDVVVSVNNMPVATTTQRAQVFQTIKAQGASITFPIQLMRNQQPITVFISVQGVPEVQVSAPVIPVAPVVPQRFEPAKPIFAPAVPQQPPQPMERKMFATPPMVNQMTQVTRDNMRTFGGQAAQIKRQNANER